MAINKIISSRDQSHSSLKKCIAYILQDSKVKDGYVGFVGPQKPDDINVDSVYDSIIKEKQLWGKDSGRMYIHSVLSFPPNEKITPREALDIGLQIAENDEFYCHYQSVLAVHQDKDQLHVHFLSNSVSFFDGKKEQHNKKDIEGLMKRTNELCRSLGLHVAEKGLHYDGTSIEPNTVTEFRTKKYRATSDKKSSYMRTCVAAIADAKKFAHDRESFIAIMNDKGYEVAWSDDRKYITFTDEDGHKMRNSTLAKTFNIDYLEDKEVFEEALMEYTEETESSSFDIGVTVADGLSTGISASALATTNVVTRIQHKANNEQKKKRRR